MKKENVASIFGSSAGLARALNISKAAISQWPSELTIRQQDEVIGAAIRLKKISPEEARRLCEQDNPRTKHESQQAQAHSPST